MREWLTELQITSNEKRTTCLSRPGPAYTTGAFCAAYGPLFSELLSSIRAEDERVKTAKEAKREKLDILSRMSASTEAHRVTPKTEDAISAWLERLRALPGTHGKRFKDVACGHNSIFGVLGTRYRPCNF